MKLVDLYKLTPETQEIHLIFGDLGILGTMDAMGCLLNNNAFSATVLNIEAEGNKLKVWIEEEEK